MVAKKARLLQTDVNIVTRLLEDEAAWGEKASDFARKILQALYDNSDEKSITATRAAVFCYAGLGVGFFVGPFDTLDAAVEAARDPNFGELKWLYPGRMVHPERYRPRSDTKKG